MAKNDTNIYGMNVQGSDATPEQFGHFWRDQWSGSVSGMAVTQNGTPNMTVTVARGTALLTKNTFTSVLAEIKSDTSVTITTANTTNPRIDAIIIYEDTSVTITPYIIDGVGGRFKVASVVGTPAASPSAITDAAIQSEIGAGKPWTRLANVTVAANTTTIINSNITDLRDPLTPSGLTSIDTRLNEALAPFVASGCVWTAISGLNGTMTAGVVYINGKRISVGAIASNSFTANRDTYVSVNDSGIVSYAPNSNNAASPALPANSIWLAIVVTNGSAISRVLNGTLTNSGYFINGYDVELADTNGKLIYPTAGQKQIGRVANPASATGITGVTVNATCGVYVPVATKVIINYSVQASATGTNPALSAVIKIDGVANSTRNRPIVVSGYASGVDVPWSGTLSAGSHVVTAELSLAAGTNYAVGSSSANPAILTVVAG